MDDVIVIGGGASGVIASINASKNNKVTLLEGEDKLLKKILLTGNGKCNYWNEEINSLNYNTNNKEYLDSIFTEDNINNAYKYLESLGIYPTVKNGYYYPYSNQASSIREILVTKLKNGNVDVKLNEKVISVKKENNKFTVITDNNIYTCSKLIISTGSKSYPKTGSDGSGYSLAKEFGHTVTPLTAALAPLKIKYNYLKDWNGVRCNATLNLNIDNEEISESGEVQLTDYGISGICVFNLSSKISRALLNKKKVKLTINFLPFTNNVMEWMNERYNSLIDFNIEEMLESIFNYKLMFCLLKTARINKEDRWNHLSYEERERLCKVLSEFEVEIDEAIFDKGQVTSGGIPLTEININTFESKIINNLYFTGELLDIDGKCGGYNLAFAFISGYIVGRGV